MRNLLEYKDLIEKEVVRKNISVRKLAPIIGVSYGVLYNIVNGDAQALQVRTRRKLDDYFGPEENEDDFSARVAAEVQKQLKAAGPSLNKIVLNEYQKEIIEKKYFKGNGFLTVYTRMKQMTPEAREVLYRLLWGIDEVLRRENYRNEGAGEV